MVDVVNVADREARLNEAIAAAVELAIQFGEARWWTLCAACNLLCQRGLLARDSSNVASLSAPVILITRSSGSFTTSSGLSSSQRFSGSQIPFWPAGLGTGAFQ